MTAARFAIVTAPYTMSTSPLAAPAIIAATLGKRYDTRFFDLNAEFNLRPDPLLSDYFLYGTIAPGWADRFSGYINDCVERIAGINPEWVGVSVFTMYGQRFTEYFCKALRLKHPEIKIILGGQGLSSNGINSNENFGVPLEERNIIDAWIKSESENSLLAVLDGDKQDKEQVADLDSVGFPCYDAYDFGLYPEKTLPITGSRGCVRKCTFCDIHKHWQRFVYRSGQNIVDEMIHQSGRTGISDFMFTDSLVNGSMKAYRDMINALALHNQDSAVPLKWSSQFIIRPKHQMTERDWINTKRSGASRLIVGVESLVEHIRDDMGKKFSNKDIMFSLEQAKANGIVLRFLMLVGYVTETEKDHEDQLRLFESLVPYRECLELSLGTTLGILPGTPLSDDPARWNITLGKNENNWSVASINNTYETRVRRRHELEAHLKSIGLIQGNAMLDLQHNLMDIWK